MSMDITRLNSFNTSFADTRGALINFLLVANNGRKSYMVIDKDIKSSTLESKRIISDENPDAATENSGYRDTEQFIQFNYDLMRTMIRSFINHCSKMNPKDYDRAVKMVLLWVAHGEFWKLLISNEDINGKIVEPIYPKEYVNFASELYLYVSSRDDKLAASLGEDAEKSNFINLANLANELDAEIFYATVERKWSTNWDALVRRYKSLTEDLNKYGQAPVELYRKYFSKVGGEYSIKYDELIAIYNKLYPDDGISRDVSKYVNDHIIPYMFKDAPSDPQVIAYKSLMTNDE